MAAISSRRRVFWIAGRWEWGWLGQGWNRLALGKVAIYFTGLPFWTIKAAAAVMVGLLVLAGLASTLNRAVDHVKAWRVARSGCPRHRGDPHFNCPACWETE